MAETVSLETLELSPSRRGKNASDSDSDASVLESPFSPFDSPEGFNLPAIQFSARKRLNSASNSASGRIIHELRKRFNTKATSASTLGLVINRFVITGIVPGGPADKYDGSVPREKRVEAHDTILTVDSEVVTDENIIRLLRGDEKDGKVGSCTTIAFRKPEFNVSHNSSQDPVVVNLVRDYKWWVEGMRDVALAVQEVGNYKDVKTIERFDESAMHTIWQAKVHTELRKLANLSAACQEGLRTHIEALEEQLTSEMLKLEDLKQQQHDEELERQLDKSMQANLEALETSFARSLANAQAETDKARAETQRVEKQLTCELHEACMKLACLQQDRDKDLRRDIEHRRKIGQDVNFVSCFTVN